MGIPTWLVSLVVLPVVLQASPATLPGAALDGDAPKSEVVRLKVGAEVVGEVLEFDEAKGIKLRRAGDGSLLEISFDQMLAEDARRIRAAAGYQSDEPEPILVDATKIRLLGGQELVGRIVERTVEMVHLRQGAKVWPLRLAGIREITPIKLDALEVYDGEEYYARELATRNPTTALDHYNLALLCESLQLWARVKEHLAKTREIDPTFKAEFVVEKTARADLRLQAGADSDLLAKYQRMAQREEFDAALKEIDEFLTKKPGSSLRVEMERARGAIVKLRTSWLKGQAVFHVFTFVDKFAESLATDGKTMSKEARKRMDLEATATALGLTSKALGVPVEELRTVWEAEGRATVSPRNASYAAGTFTLGVDAALKGLTADNPLDPKKGKEAAGTKAGDGEGVDDLIKKLIEKKKKEAEEADKRAKSAPKKQKRGPEIADVPPTEEEWWAAASADERSSYLFAWWAEHEPSVQLILVESRNCTACAGEGWRRVIDSTGQEKKNPCERCKTLGIDRLVRFK